MRYMKHGKATRLYLVYCGIKNRCYNKNSPAYERYGGRGIRMCDDWFNDFDLFESWAYSNGYNKDAKRGECTIDRIDNNGDYDPANCRWVNFKKQANNKHNNILVTINGETATLKETSEKYGVNYKLAWKRMRVYGWDAQRALFEEKHIKAEG